MNPKCDSVKIQTAYSVLESLSKLIPQTFPIFLTTLTTITKVVRVVRVVMVVKIGRVLRMVIVFMVVGLKN